MKADDDLRSDLARPVTLDAGNGVLFVKADELGAVSDFDVVDDGGHGWPSSMSV